MRQSTVRTNGPTGLRARGLTRSFDGQEVLSSVDLAIPSGAFAAIEGPNGAGKTTLLRVFATVVRPDSGEATVDGFDVMRDAALVRERIGAAFVNERSIYWRLTGRENLRLFGQMHGLDSRIAEGRVETLLGELGLTEIADRWVADLSAGQRQRFIVARAGLGEPSCLLIDEPLRGLDDHGIALMLSFLRGQAARGAAVLAVAPKFDELNSAADVYFKMNDAKISSWPGSRESGAR